MIGNGVFFYTQKLNAMVEEYFELDEDMEEEIRIHRDHYISTKVKLYMIEKDLREYVFNANPVVNSNKQLSKKIDKAIICLNEAIEILHDTMYEKFGQIPTG